MRLRLPALLGRALPLSLPFILLPLSPLPASALSLNPLDYYDVDYRIAVSHTEVEPGDSFSVSAVADIRCIKDMPFGVDEATGVASVLARHMTSDVELVLLESYEVTIDGFPDWEGDEYSLDESIDLLFPDDAPDGAYELVAKLDRVSLDGWNVTALIPRSYRTFVMTTITCATEEVPPVPPAPKPGTLRVAILGHDFHPSLDTDGTLFDRVAADLVEGRVSLVIEPGTRCEDGAGEPLDYISVSGNPRPPAYADGVVVAAYSVQPSGAAFYPAIEFGIAYESGSLPTGAAPTDLLLAWYDGQAAVWRKLSTTVDSRRNVAYADVSHFSTVGLLAPTAAPGPARFEAHDLSLSPTRVAPLGKVLASVTVTNSGGTTGTYQIEVLINAEHSQTQDIVLGPRESRTLRFVVARSRPGVYVVDVAGLTGEFTVVAPATAGDDPAQDSPDVTSASGGGPAASKPIDHGGLHPIYVVLLAMAGVTFMTLVILVLAGVL